jgi:uncharacterized protein YjbJ (UPF0337 family)
MAVTLSYWRRISAMGSTRGDRGVAGPGDSIMKWQQIAADWQRHKDRVQLHWWRLTEADLASIEGDQARLTARLQERYDLHPDDAEREVDAFLDIVKLPRAA